MRASVIVFLTLQAAFALAAVGLAADDAAEKEARQLFRSAFAENVEAKKRVEILEALVKDHADSRWADDALWALGEMAAQAGRREQAVQYRRGLMERATPPSLESFTCNLPIYSNSRVPKALYLLTVTGNRYAKDGIKAVPFNPVPMLVHEDLALDYEAMKMLNQALREYQLAAAVAPKDDFFEKLYLRRAGQLEEKIKQLESIKAGKTDEKEPDANKPKDNQPEEPKTDKKPDKPKQKEGPEPGKEKND